MAQQAAGRKSDIGPGLSIQNPKFYPGDTPLLITPHLLLIVTLPMGPLSFKPPRFVSPETLTLIEENTGNTL